MPTIGYRLYLIPPDEAEAWAAGEAARELEARESMLLTARGDAQR